MLQLFTLVYEGELHACVARGEGGDLKKSICYPISIHNA